MKNRKITVFLSFIGLNHGFRMFTHSTLPIFIHQQKTSLKAFLPDNFDTALYDFQLQASSTLSHDLASASLISSTILLGAGILSSLSPCSLGLLPISVSYLTAAKEANPSVSIVKITDREEAEQSTAIQSESRTIFYILGTLIAFAGLGASSAAVGSLLGSSLQGYGFIKDFFLAALYIIMGLSLAEVLPINFAQLIKTDSLTKNSGEYSEGVQAALLGASSALVGSSCTTPVLSSVLALIASYGNVGNGAILLVFYGLGYSVPLLTAKYVLREISFSKLGGQLQWINQFFASLLLVYGGYLAVNFLFSLIE